jgi:hypothetical protein
VEVNGDKLLGDAQGYNLFGSSVGVGRGQSASPAQARREQSLGPACACTKKSTDSAYVGQG